METASEPLLTCLQRMNELAEVVGPDFGRHIGFQAVSGNLDLTVMRFKRDKIYQNMIELMRHCLSFQKNSGLENLGDLRYPGVFVCTWSLDGRGEV